MKIGSFAGLPTGNRDSEIDQLANLSGITYVDKIQATGSNLVTISKNAKMLYVLGENSANIRDSMFAPVSGIVDGTISKLCLANHDNSRNITLSCAVSGDNVAISCTERTSMNALIYVQG